MASNMDRLVLFFVFIKQHHLFIIPLIFIHLNKSVDSMQGGVVKQSPKLCHFFSHFSSIAFDIVILRYDILIPTNNTKIPLRQQQSESDKFYTEHLLSTSVKMLQHQALHQSPRGRSDKHLSQQNTRMSSPVHPQTHSVVGA